MSAKDIGKFLLLLVVFYSCAPYVIGGLGSLFYGQFTERLILYPNAVEGTVTGNWYERQHFKFYLDSKSKPRYDFDAFVQDSEFPMKANLKQEEVNKLILGSYLKLGDFVSKSANSDSLLVRRGDTVTTWRCQASVKHDWPWLN